ncbi:hypothetical protein BX666DRAFT_1954379 [Dichotomocladium elegans]|nr:hypothetical protein BX666DRAFT_1954379 [Dichotomocladium elegans]
MDFIFGTSDRKRKADNLDHSDEKDVKKQQLDGDADAEQQQEQQQESAVEQSPDIASASKQQSDEQAAPELTSQPSNADQTEEATPAEANKETPQEDVTASTTEKHSPVPAQQAENVVPFNRLIVLNVAATCDESMTMPSVQVTKENSEVIELSFVVIDTSNMEVVHTEQIYAKPERTPLTEYCQQVTGITSEMLEGAGNLQNAISRLDDYIKKEIDDQCTFCFVTHGAWTLRIQLPREARDKGIELPSYLSFCRMFDLKQEIQRWQVHHRDINVRSMSLKDLCEAFQLERVTDKSAGLNACLTTVNVIRYLTEFRHPDVFVHPIDTNADLQQFKKEESTVVHLAGLPFEVTQGELEAWFSSNGLRPAATYMIQTSDYSKPNLSGFVVFTSHDDAMRALQLNGRCLGDRAVEVSPSSERVIEAAGSMLVPFPAQSKGRALRPGDWNCPGCGFHNFASRRTCFKCNTENPNAPPAIVQSAPLATSLPSQPMATHSQNFIPGDWICPNYSCSFHNYASRYQCFKCGTFRPQNAGSASHGGPPGHNAPPSYGRPHHPITFRPGDWYCPNPTCGFQNFASRISCFKCHTPNPTSGQRPSYGQQPSYGYGSESSYGGAYGQGNYQAPANNSYGYGPHSTGASAPFRPGDWYCPSCNSHNFASRFQCLKCATPKPHGGQTPPTTYPPANAGLKPGDWICANEACGFHSKLMYVWHQ